jgi:hypothetical protein
MYYMCYTTGIGFENESIAVWVTVLNVSYYNYVCNFILQLVKSLNN